MLRRIKNFFCKEKEDEMELLPCDKNCNKVIAILEEPNEIIYINDWGLSRKKICKYLHPKENDAKRLVRITKWKIIPVAELNKKLTKLIGDVPKENWGKIDQVDW